MSGAPGCTSTGSCSTGLGPDPTKDPSVALASRPARCLSAAMNPEDFLAMLAGAPVDVLECRVHASP